MAKANLAHVDTMRGLAILMVVLVHTAASVPYLSNQLVSLSAYGQMGVQLFFVASAFTLCHSANQRRGEPVPLMSYAMRRVFRIAPMYYIGIVLYGALGVLENWVLLRVLKFNAEFTLGNVLANVFFIHGFMPGGANNNIVLGGWSIGTEMAFYAVFPLLFAGFMRKGRITLGNAGLVLAATVEVTQLILVGVLELTGMRVVENGFMYFNIVNQLPVFVLGMLLFFLDKWPFNDIWSNVLGFIAFTSVAAQNWASTQPNFSAIPVLAGMSFVFLFKLLEMAPVLNPSFIRKVGKVSFSMYILHFFFAYKVTRALGKVLVPKLGGAASLLILFVLAVGCSYVAALAAQWLVEARFINLGRRLIARLHRRESTQTVVIEHYHR